jgi:hypothetical protein
VVSETDTNKNEPNPNVPESTAVATASTSLVLLAVVAAISKKDPNNQQGTCFAEITQRASTKRDA